MKGVAAVVSLGLGMALASAAPAATPPLVEAYARQLAAMCGPLPSGAIAPAALVQEIDLNGDKVSDWVVDAGRYPCPGRPAIAVAAGTQVTVFKGLANGSAVPAFQRATFGSHLARNAQGAPVLWVTLGGADCGAPKPEERCERVVAWQSAGGRFDATPPPKAVGR